MKKILADHLVLDGYLFITWIAVFVYLGLLRLLPTLGIIDKKKEEPPAEPKPEEPKKNA